MAALRVAERSASNGWSLVEALTFESLDEAASRRYIERTELLRHTAGDLLTGSVSLAAAAVRIEIVSTQATPIWLSPAMGWAGALDALVQTLAVIADLRERGAWHGDISRWSMLIEPDGTVIWTLPRSSGAMDESHESELRAAARLFLELQGIEGPLDAAAFRSWADDHFVPRSVTALLRTLGLFEAPSLPARAAARVARFVAREVAPYEAAFRIAIEDGGFSIATRHRLDRLARGLGLSGADAATIERAGADPLFDPTAWLQTTAAQFASTGA